MTDLIDITIGLLLALSLVLAAIGISAFIVLVGIDIVLTPIERRERRVRR